MSPTRRDLFRRAAATVAAASIATLPLVPVAVQPSRLVAAFDIEDPVPYGLAAVNGFLLIHWTDWTIGERKHFLEVIEREFPAIAADAADHLEHWAQRQEAI